MRVRLGAALGWAVLALAGCGGDERHGAAAPSVASAASEPRLRAAAVDARGVDPLDAADQLFEYAEARFPDYFPGAQPSQSLDGWRFRHYPAAGTYLGVRDGQAFVMGGAFGPQPVAVGPLTQYLTPRPLAERGACATDRSRTVVQTSRSAAVGGSAAAVLVGCAGPLQDPAWRQTEGPRVALLSDRSQAIAFDPPAAGVYRFEATWRDADGTARSALVALAAAAAGPAETRLALRGSQAVRMGGKVSLRAWPHLAPGDAVESVTWTQSEGPAVQLKRELDPRLATFVAPTVERDTLVRVRAELRTRQGATAQDETLVLIERPAQTPAADRYALWDGTHVARVRPFVAEGRYRHVLQPCVFDARQTLQELATWMCPLSKLPLLAHESFDGVPSVERVMERVLVSHDWQGRSLEALLRQHDPDGELRRMLGSVTAIVIAADILPSFYHPATGAIYLDPEPLWRTAEERDTVNEAADERSSYDDGLAYASLWRYVRDGRRLFTFYDPGQRLERSAEAVRDEALPVLYHELLHALDFVPVTQRRFLEPRQPLVEFIWQQLQGRSMASTQLKTRFPLASELLRELAQVKFRGIEATEVQRGHRADTVAAAFAADLAVDEYSYVDEREDAAMLVEAFLVRRRLGADRDVAFTDPVAETDTAASIVVRWGQRGRVGEAALRSRLRLALQELAPWVPAGEVDLLPPPTAMRAGDTWADTLGRGSVLQQPRLRPFAVPGDVERWQLRRDVRRPHPRSGSGAAGTRRLFSAAAAPPAAATAAGAR